MELPPELFKKVIREVRGSKRDLYILLESKWLINTEVGYHITERKGRWHLSILYIALENPMKLICRPIDAYHSLKKAETYARILQRGIRKDARGTLKTNRNAFNICYN